MSRPTPTYSMNRAQLIARVSDLEKQLLDARFSCEAALSVLTQILNRWDDHEKRLRELETRKP